MNGFSLCDVSANSRLPSGSPGLTTTPDAPPSIICVKVLRSRPPLALSELWQARHLSRRIGTTCWSKVTLPFVGSAGNVLPQRQQRTQGEQPNRTSRIMISPRCHGTHSASLLCALCVLCGECSSQWLKTNSRVLSSAQKTSSSAPCLFGSSAMAFCSFCISAGDGLRLSVL